MVTPWNRKFDDFLQKYFDAASPYIARKHDYHAKKLAFDNLMLSQESERLLKKMLLIEKIESPWQPFWPSILYNDYKCITPPVRLIDPKYGLQVWLPFAGIDLFGLIMLLEG